MLNSPDIEYALIWWAELNIKARPGRASSLGAGLTMQQIPKRYENS